MKFFKFLSAVIVSFFILSCSGLNLDSKTGSISIRLPEETSETRAFTTQEKYDLSFTISVIDSDHNTVDQKDGTPGAEVVFNELQVGAYIVHCRCYANIDGKQHVYAQAKDTVEILADKVAQLTLTLKIETEFLQKEPEKDAEKEPEVTEEEEKQETEKDKEVIEGEGDKGQTTTPEGDPDDDPLKDKDIVHEDPKQEETLSLPDAYSEFDLTTAIKCSDWASLKEAIGEMPFKGTQVFLLSGEYTADSMIYMNNSHKIFIMATASTKITVTKEESFDIVSDEVIIYGTEKAPITFTGEAAGSMFNVSGENANLTLTGNVNFENFKNSYANAGGAIYMIDGRCTIAGGITFTNCEATKSDGGAIYVLGGSLVISGDNETSPVVFNNCKAAGNGGAIYIEQTRESELATLLNIQFGTETGKENSCGGNGPDICINSNAPYSESVSINGYIGSASDRIDIYAANTFVFSSYIETTSEIYITFNDEAFNKAVAKSEPLLNTNLTPYEENLRSLIYVRAESDGDMWKNITEDGMVINE